MIEFKFEDIEDMDFEKEENNSYSDLFKWLLDELDTQPMKLRKSVFDAEIKLSINYILEG